MPLAVMFVLLGLLTFSQAAQAQTEKMLGKYAAAKDQCEGPGQQVFEMRRGVLEGPDFHCIFGNPRDGSGPGIEDHDAKCRKGGEVIIGIFTMDLGKAPAEIKVKLPEAQGWIALHRCD